MLISALLLSTLLSAERSIHQCRDAAGRLIYQDQPCRGQLTDIDRVPAAQAWRLETLGPCQLRSPRIEMPVLARQPRTVEPSPDPFPDAPEFEGPAAAEDEAEPLVIGLWLEMNGSADGVALRIRGFDPLPVSGMSFDSNINGQGIRNDQGSLIEVDSMDGPGSLRYGFRGSAILLSGLIGSSSAQLEVRIPGYQTIPTRFDLEPIAAAVKQLRDCGRPAQGPHRRRLPGQ